jgi:hypothetical protein
MSVNKNILKELEELVPGFGWPEKHVDFEVPEGYFTELPDAVLNRINGHEREELPVPLSRENAFDTPAGYFENLPLRILNKINEENKKTPVVRLPRSRRKWPNWAAAAAIAAFVAAGGMLWLIPPRLQNNPQASISFNQQLASLSNQAIEQYLSTQINSSNMNEVYKNLSDQDLQDALTSGLSTSAIKEYLQNNELDSSSF